MTEISSVSGLRGVREALAELFGLVESGELVRDISRDGESDWLRRAAKLTLTLKKAQLALSLPPSPQAQLTGYELAGCCDRAGVVMRVDRKNDPYGLPGTDDWNKLADEVRRAGAQGQVQGVQQSEDASSHPPSKLDGSMATASDSVSAASIVVKRIFEIQQWVLKVAPHVFEQQKHLDEGSPERAYWHYGYLCALNDVLEKLTAMPSPIQAVAENAASPEVVEKTLAVSVPPADVSSQAGQAPSETTEWRWLRLRGYLRQWLTPHHFEIAMDCLDKADAAAPSAGSGQELRDPIQELPTSPKRLPRRERALHS